MNRLNQLRDGLNAQNRFLLLENSTAILVIPGNTKDIQKDGNLKEYEELDAQYAPMINALMRKLHIYRDYESFRQVGKIALWQASIRYDESKGNFTAFAYRTIHGAMLDHLKKEAKYIERNLVQQNHEFDDLVFCMEEDELPEWIDARYLKNGEKRLLEELFVKGTSLTGLAASEGVSLAGMKKRRERVLKKLKENIGPDQIALSRQ
ncbi:sigma-70 family RNA polymerase sigma factor [Planococcus ruber]|uniref:sigma-70 family RNA polymerase sigma factor n=1 Tax=Planococcus ruber TaxID=2027871 RepID=UPI001FED4920|nr:sigma-70 family RNA polymerase sigma factor [Planococcus ruber]MCJ1908401.1 sigma-70 family RNA polymerase sigma factor [Planococcus ruber]